MTYDFVFISDLPVVNPEVSPDGRSNQRSMVDHTSARCTFPGRMRIFGMAIEE